MSDSILFRGASQDSREAKEILRESNIQFIEIYSESENHSPVLHTSESAYAYKGITQIREYACSIKFQKMKK